MLLLAGFLVSLRGGSEALAQSREQWPDSAFPQPDIPVDQRVRPDFEPVGGRIGTWILRPDVELTQGYNSNITKDDTPLGDAFTEIRPSFNLRSDWGRHKLAVKGEGEFGFHAEHQEENYGNYGFETNGLIDIDRGTEMVLIGRYRHEIEDRGSPSSKDTRRPTEMDIGKSWFQVDRDTGRFRGTFLNRTQHLTHSDAAMRSGQTSSQGYRDRDEYRTWVRGGPVFGDSHYLFGQIGHEWIDYRDDVDTVGINRDAREYSIMIGGEFDNRKTLSGEFALGYSYRQPADRSLRERHGLAFNGKLLWNPTGLTSVTLDGSRRFVESDMVEEQALLETRARVRLDHELLRNVLLNSMVGVKHEGWTDTNNENWIVDTDFGVKWLVNRNWTVEGHYGYEAREAWQEVDDYGQHVLSTRIRLRL